MILWVDTFNNYFHPADERGGARGAAGGRLPRRAFRAATCAAAVRCTTSACSTQAKQYLQHVMLELGPQIDAGYPMVVLEPSCASVFRDELRNLFPDDPRADRLRRQTFLLSEFLTKQVPDYRPPQLSGKVLLHGHCHQKAIMKMDHEEALLRKMGAEVQVARRGLLRHGRAVRVLGGEVRGVEGDRRTRAAAGRAARRRKTRVIVADGFSCQEQIAQLAGRRAIHLAEAMRNALK